MKLNNFMEVEIMKTLLILTVLYSIGCAHQTTYEKCKTDNDFLRYGSMEKCEAERSQEKGFFGRIGGVVKGAAVGGAQGMNAPNKNIRCNSYNDGLGNAVTNCR